MQLANGKSGTFRISPETGSNVKFSIEVVTDKGGVKVTDRQVTVLKRDDDRGEQMMQRITPFKADNGVKRMVAAFTDSIEKGREDVRGPPQQALEDLKIIDAMLKSAEDGGKIVEI